MQNRLIAICLLVALISSNFSRFFVFAGFEANQKFIASSLCENKSRPWMHCNGKCYLMKKLKQAEEKEKKQEREDQKSRYQEALPCSVATVNILKSTFKVEYLPGITPGIVNRSSSIFQPPQV
jgi:hypothetical protein